MGSPIVVPSDVFSNVFASSTNIVKGKQIHPLVLHRALKPFNEHVIALVTTTVHGEFHTVIKHRIDKLLSGKRAALIGVDDLGFTKSFIGFEKSISSAC